MVRAMVHSKKHVVQLTFSTATGGATTIFTAFRAVERTVANASTEVMEGSTVKAVYVELWAVATAVDQFHTIILSKLPGGVGNITNANMAALDSYNNKKNVFYTSQGLTPQESTQGPLAVLRGWIKIPKTKQRFGLGDALQLAVASRGASDINFCGLFVFKEYS